MISSCAKNNALSIIYVHLFMSAFCRSCGTIWNTSLQTLVVSLDARIGFLGFILRQGASGNVTELEANQQSGLSIGMDWESLRVSGQTSQPGRKHENTWLSPVSFSLFHFLIFLSYWFIITFLVQELRIPEGWYEGNVYNKHDFVFFFCLCMMNPHEACKKKRH